MKSDPRRTLQVVLSSSSFLAFVLVLAVPGLVLSNDPVAKSNPLPIAIPLEHMEGSGSKSVPKLDGLSYEQLDALREPRLLLIDYLIEAGKIREAPNGTLDFLQPVARIGQEAVAEENRVRQKMFEVISELEKKAIGAVGREFHQARTKPKAPQKEASGSAGPSVREVDPALVISAPLAMDRTFLGNLVSSYMASLGYGEVRSDLDGKRIRMIGHRAFGSGFLAIDVQLRSPDEEIPKDAVVIETEKLGASLPENPIHLEGISIVAHPDTPVRFLTVDQVAGIFAGEITSWDEVSTGDGEVAVVLPKNQGDDTILFRDIVLEPADEKMMSSEQTAGSLEERLAAIASRPGAIGFCLIGEESDKVKRVPIRAVSDSLAIHPSHGALLSLDYPLAKAYGISANGSEEGFIEDFLNFTQAEAASMAAAAEGDTDEVNAESKQMRRTLLIDPMVPEKYRNLIRKADRINSPANFRFVEGTKDFELTAYSEANLQQLVRYLKASPDKYSKVILFGFADSYGSDSANLTYSEKRADSIADRLREEGIERIETVGIGEEMPVADNDTEDGRYANQRVEVWLERSTE